MFCTRATQVEPTPHGKPLSQRDGHHGVHKEHSYGLCVSAYHVV